jgi:diphthine-ammonia ligase
MKKAFVSWSGGKDCCQAAYRAIQQGFNIRYLLNTVSQDGQRSCSHGISSQWLRLQSEALGIPVVQILTAGDNYEAVFTNALLKFKSEGIETGIFGDIDFNAHREWIERVCGKAGITPVLPLWLMQQDKIARDFIDDGFEAVVVATRADLLGKEWLGRKYDAGFLQDLTACSKNITPCGEAGEFHTLVVDGPLFKKRLAILETAQVPRDNHWFLDIRQCELREKELRVQL